MPTISAIRLPIAWTDFGWPEVPSLGGVSLTTGDPEWAWDPVAPSFAVRVMEHTDGEPINDFVVDHVVLLVPDLEAAVATIGRIDLQPRLRMTIPGNRPAAFFRVGPVLEVVQAPVRQASLYGIALATTGSLEALSITWKGLGLQVGDIKPAIQPGRRIMTVHGMDAGFAVMSPDGPVAHQNET
jgi:hypothetical protein